MRKLTDSSREFPKGSAWLSPKGSFQEARSKRSLPGYQIDSEWKSRAIYGSTTTSTNAGKLSAPFLSVTLSLNR